LTVYPSPHRSGTGVMNGLEALLKPCPKHAEMRQGEFPAGFPHDI
jgi:hypothetical protein